MIKEMSRLNTQSIVNVIYLTQAYYADRNYFTSYDDTQRLNSTCLSVKPGF
jgi:hypothetical protein